MEEAIAELSPHMMKYEDDEMRDIFFDGLSDDELCDSESSSDVLAEPATTAPLPSSLVEVKAMAMRRRKNRKRFEWHIRRRLELEEQKRTIEEEMRIAEARFEKAEAEDKADQAEFEAKLEASRMPVELYE
jgi:hypothetical protein